MKITSFCGQVRLEGVTNNKNISTQFFLVQGCTANQIAKFWTFCSENSYLFDKSVFLYEGYL